jgi:uncharacterized membrane protein (DUF373 family)
MVDLNDIISHPNFLVPIDDVLSIFGLFLLVLIGLELLETIQAYLNEKVVHTRIVLEVALIAIARKVIILDVKELSPVTLLGIAALIITLAMAYYIECGGGNRGFRKRAQVSRKRENLTSERGEGDSLP